MNWSRVSTGVAVVVAMLVAGCGDDDPDVDTATVDESAEVDEEPDEPPERSEAPEESPEVDEEPEESAEESEAPEESPEVDEEPEESAEVGEEPDESARRWSEDDVEYLLAVAGEGERLDLDDPVIDAYAAVLDAAAEYCPEERSMVGDIAVRAVQILGEEVPAHNETVLTMLQAIAESAAAAEGTQDCSSIAATLIVLIMEG